MEGDFPIFARIEQRRGHYLPCNQLCFGRGHLVQAGAGDFPGPAVSVVDLVST